MPQRRTAVKDLRKNQSRKLHNLGIKKDLKNTIRSYMAALTQDNREEAVKTLRGVYKKLDKAAKRNILHKKTAARRKSKFAKLLKQSIKA